MKEAKSYLAGFFSYYICELQLSLDFTQPDFTLNFKFTLKSLVITKLKIYWITCLNFMLYLDFTLHLSLTNNIVKSRFDYIS